MAGLYTQGWLEKKSGGKEGQNKLKFSEKWTRRWFVLVGSELRYFKSDEDYNKGKAALGAVECSGASLKLKEVQGNSFRFTLLSAERELKLRGPSSAYHTWNDALSKFVTKDDGNGSGAGSAGSQVRSRAFTEGEAPGLAAGSGSFDGPTTESGWLEKKSGGKEGAGVSSSFVRGKLLEKWTKRWFVLAGSELRYYRSDEEYEKGKLPLGLVECSGAELSLKHVKGQTFRFNVLSASRELKLRAQSPDEYQKWTRALTPLCGSTRQDTEESSRGDDDDDELLGQLSDGGGEEQPAASKREEQAGGSGGGGSAGGAASGPDGAGNPFAAMWGGVTSAAAAVNPFGESDEKGKEATSSNPFGESVGEAVGEAMGGLIKRLSMSSMQEEEDDKEELREKQKLEEQEQEDKDKDSEEDDDDWKAVEEAEGSEEEGARPPQVRTTDPWSSAPSADAHSPAGSEGSPTLPPEDELARRRSLDLSFPEGDDLTPEDSPRRDGSPAAAHKAGQKPEQERARAGSFLSRILSPRTSKTPPAAVTADEGSGGGGGGNLRTSSANPFEEEEEAEEALGAGSDGGNPFGGSALPPVPTAGSRASSSNPFGDDGYSPSTPPAQLPAVSAPLGLLDPLGSSAPALPLPPSAAAATPADYGGGLPGMTAAGTGAGVGMGGPAVSDSTAAPFKMIIVGDSSVGKTCLLVRFVEGRYDGAAKPTISVDISSAALDLGSSTVALSLWDTAGQEKFAPLSAPYFRQADGVIIAFDVGARSSFERVASYWMDEVFFKADPDV